MGNQLPKDFPQVVEDRILRGVEHSSDVLASARQRHEDKLTERVAVDVERCAAGEGFPEVNPSLRVRLGEFRHQREV